MKTLLAIILILLAIAVVALVVVRFPTAAPAPPPEPTPQPRPVAGSPRDAVVSYLEALYRKDYRAAYDHLSAASQQAHPYPGFLKLCEKGVATNFDLAAARERPAEGSRVTVTVPLVEDPAEAGFTTVHEDGGWKVVFSTGVPWFPYP